MKENNDSQFVLQPLCKNTLMAKHCSILSDSSSLQNDSLESCQFCRSMKQDKKKSWHPHSVSVGFLKTLRMQGWACRDESTEHVGMCVCVSLSLTRSMGAHTNASSTNSRVKHKSMGIKASDTWGVREQMKDRWNRDAERKNREETGRRRRGSRDEGDSRVWAQPLKNNACCAVQDRTLSPW